MKKILLTPILLLLCLSFIFAQQNVGISKDGSEPHPSAMLDVKSTDQGILVPRLTSEQRSAIDTPANGLLVYDVSTNSFWYYQQDRWIEIGGSGLGPLTLPSPSPLVTQTLPSGSGFPLLDVQGNYLYLAKNTTDDPTVPDSLLVIDVTDPFAAQVLGKRRIGRNPASIVVQGQYAYITDTNEDNLRIMDISDPNAPDSVSQVALGNNPNAMVVQGSYAYVVDIQDGFLRVIDVADPGSPAQVGSLGIGQSPVALAVQENYLFIITGQGVNLRVIDVSNPAQPNQVAVISLFTGVQHFPIDIAVQGDYAYIIDQNSNELKVIDITNKVLPSQVGLLSFGNISSPRHIKVSGSYAYVTDWDNDNLQVINISDPTAPVAAGSVAIGPLPEELAVAGNYAFVTEVEQGQVHIVRITTPAPIGVSIDGDIVSIAASENDPSSGIGLQQLSLTGSQLSISQGNTVNLDQVGFWKTNGNDLYNLNLGNIGIGTNTPIVLGSDKVLELRSGGLDSGGLLQLSNLDRSRFLRVFSGRQLDPNPLLMWPVGGDLRLATDQFGFDELVRFTGDGKIGIRTGADIQLQLSLGDSDTGLQQEGDGELSIYSDSEQVMRISRTARVGIGTLEPEEKLHVVGTVKADAFMGDGSQITGIPYPDDSNTNELQTLSVNGTDLTISGGNTVTIPVNAGGGGSWGVNGDDIYNINAGSVGVKVTDPITGFQVGGDQEVLFGADTTGAGSRLFWMPSKGAFRAGTLGSSFGGEETFFNPSNIGQYSIAAGYNVLASGYGSVALGLGNQATGYDGATAIGVGNFALGNFGATALGHQTIAEGDEGATALGYGSYSAGFQGSTAIGYFTFANGNKGATAIGKGTTANGNNGATAIGNETTATGNGGAIALGEFSLAAGNSGAVSLGYSSQALGDFGSIAIGDDTRSTGHNGATAIGRQTLANAYSMIALGSNNDTLSGYTKDSWVETDPVLMIGNGQSSAERKTAMTVLKNGNIGIGAMNPDQLLTLSALQTPVLRFERTGNQGFFDWELFATEGRFGFRGGANGTGNDLIEYITFENNGRVKIKDLESLTTRMVVADSEGRLGTQALPGGTGSLVSPWLRSGDNIYFDGGKVGIGTSNPVSDLSVRGGMTIGSSYASGGRSVVPPANGLMIQGNLGVGDHDFAGSKEAAQPITIIANDEPVLRLERASSRHDWEVYTKTVFGNPSDGPAGRFSIRGGANGVGSQLADFFTIREDGYIGLGSNNPVTKLDIQGNVYLGQNNPKIGFKEGQTLQIGSGGPENSPFLPRLQVLSNGQFKVNNQISGNGTLQSHFGMVVDARDHGLLIELNGETPNDTHNYISFAGEDPNGLEWIENGRITGQTLEDYQGSFEFAWYNTMAAIDLALAAAELGACLAQADVFEATVMTVEAVAGGVEWGKWFTESQNNVGVAYESGSGDYAEWLPKTDAGQDFHIGEVVGVKGGEVSYQTEDADHVMVVSKSPIVLGNMPPAGDDPGRYEKIAFLGQVQTKVVGKVQKGDYILASGNNDGMGVAKAPGEMQVADYRRIVGVAWSESGDRAVNLINTAVGINANDVSLQLEKQEKEMKELKDKVAGLESQIDQILAHLKGVELLETSGEKESKEEPVVMEMAEPNVPLVTKLGMEMITDEELKRVLQESGQAKEIIAHFDQLSAYYEEHDIDLNRFPELKRIYDDPIQALIDIKNGKLFPTMLDRLREQKK